MYVQVSEQENRVAEAKSNGLGIRVTCLFYLSGAFPKNTHFGARKSHHIKKNLAHIDEFASNITVLSCDSNTARKYGLIKNSLLEKGKPIPENDIWIAAVALQHGLIIATRDDHFNKVEKLKCEAW